MNKKYLNCTVLMVLLISINLSFAMDNKDKKDGSLLWNLGAVAAAALYIAYPVLPVFANKLGYGGYENVSPKTQEWAKNVLQESGIKDADRILLKKEKYGNKIGWAAAGSHFIVVPNGFDPVKCSYLERLESKGSLKHEVKHVQNYDGVKRNALLVGTIALGSLLVQEQPSLTIPIISVGYGVNMAYCKYQESEADRFACEKATSREELEIRKNYFLEHRQSEKDAILAVDLEKVEKKLADIKNESSYCDLFEAKGTLLLLKKIKSNPDMAVDVVNFIFDREHPSLKSRVAMVQDYMDKWDKEHPDDMPFLPQNNADIGDYYE